MCALKEEPVEPIRKETVDPGHHVVGDAFPPTKRGATREVKIVEPTIDVKEESGSGDLRLVHCSYFIYEDGGSIEVTQAGEGAALVGGEKA